LKFFKDEKKYNVLHGSFGKKADKMVTKWLEEKITKEEAVYMDQIGDKMN
jgi:hypothetical protein